MKIGLVAYRRVHFYYFAPGEVRSIVMSMSVCLSVCLSVYLSPCITRKPHDRTSPKFCWCCLWPWLGPSLPALRYVVYFWFCGWRHVFIQLGKRNRIKHDVMFRMSSPGVETSWTSDNCRVGRVAPGPSLLSTIDLLRCCRLRVY